MMPRSASSASSAVAPRRSGARRTGAPTPRSSAARLSASARAPGFSGRRTRQRPRHRARGTPRTPPSRSPAARRRLCARGVLSRDRHSRRHAKSDAAAERVRKADRHASQRRQDRQVGLAACPGVAPVRALASPAQPISWGRLSRGPSRPPFDLLSEGLRDLVHGRDVAEDHRPVRVLGAIDRLHGERSAPTPTALRLPHAAGSSARTAASRDTAGSRRSSPPRLRRHCRPRARARPFPGYRSSRYRRWRTPPSILSRGSKESLTPERRRGAGHELHEALRPLAGNRPGIERRLRADHRVDQGLGSTP